MGMRFRIPNISSKSRFSRAVGSPRPPGSRQCVKRGTRSRQAALWLLGTALFLVVLGQLLPNLLTDNGTIAQLMRRDARPLDSAAWKHCHRKVSTNRQKCMFCGELVLAGSPFEKAQIQ